MQTATSKVSVLPAKNVGAEMSADPVADGINRALGARNVLQKAREAERQAQEEERQAMEALGELLASCRLFMLGNYVLLPATEIGKEQLLKAQALAAGGKP